MRRTSDTSTSSRPSACGSTLCRPAPPRVKNCSARHASTCLPAQMRSGPMTGARAFTAKEAALTRAEDANTALNEQIAALEAARSAEKQAAYQRIEELGTSL